MARTFWVGGNWKMNGSLASNKDLIQKFNAAKGVKPTADGDFEVVIGVPAVYINQVATELRSDWQVAGENSYVQTKGAFTGELAPEMLKDVGAKWVILGHSERRHVMGESFDFIAEKTGKALAAGLKVSFCVGETDKERVAGNTYKVIENQLAPLIKLIKESDWVNIVIAYEPVWAIGTGKTATPDQAEEVHAWIRSHIAKAVSPKVAEKVRIAYGGSVSDNNCLEIGKKPNVDGFLVGGASLKPAFIDIAKAGAEVSQ